MEQVAAEPGGALLTHGPGRTIGDATAVPLLDGGRRRYVHLDHAASTPPFAAVQDAVNRFGSWYANVHRGTGFKSRLSSWAYDEARRAVLAFVGAGDGMLAVFLRNTTEALNHAAHCIRPRPGQCIVTTLMEHHSNDLPWRRTGAEIVRVGVCADGRVDEAALRRVLAERNGRVALLAVSGASNVTGIVNPVHTWARWAHQAGARIAVDAAQWVPHRPVDIRPADDPGHLDILACSAHKMYAPFGTGVLVAPRALLEDGEPRLTGGGTVDVVNTQRAVYTGAPEREEAGTPCIVGAVALAAALREYRAVGWDEIVHHERHLGDVARDGLRAIPGVTLYGDGPGDHLAVLAFTIEGVPHALAATVLAEEWGIGTRSGCFCAHGYVKSLLGLDPTREQDFERRILAGDHADVPGMVRASFGLDNTEDDARLLVDAVAAIACGHYGRGYFVDPATGEYQHDGAATDFASYFAP